tara:strand:- start:920 stop:1078 length:159 start_codon:yes stop_codon:yes gene_type:complete
MESYTSTQIESMYLDYFNNFLSIERFAEYYNLSVTDADEIIKQGRIINSRKM